MKAKSIKGKSPVEIKTALLESMSDGFKPTLAIVFLSVKQDRMAISKLLDTHAISIFGATTSGEFIDEATEKDSVAMLLLDMTRDHFKIYFEELTEKKLQGNSQGCRPESQ